MDRSGDRSTSQLTWSEGRRAISSVLGGLKGERGHGSLQVTDREDNNQGGVGRNGRQFYLLEEVRGIASRSEPVGGNLPEGLDDAHPNQSFQECNQASHTGLALSGVGQSCELHHEWTV